MEFLLQIVSALLVLPVIGGLAWMLEILGVLILGALAQSGTHKMRWRKTVWSFASLLGFGLIGLICVDLFLFDPCVRMLINQVESRSNISIQFKEAEGSLFLGRIKLISAHIRQGDQMDLTLEEAELNVNMLGAFQDEVPIEYLRVQGVHGTLSYAKKAGDNKGHPFSIDQVVLKDVHVLLEDPKFHLLHLPVDIESLTISPLRSEEVVWDVLCNSTAKVQVFSQNLTARKGWTLENIPLSSLTNTIGLPALPARVDVILTCPAPNTLNVGINMKPINRFVAIMTPDVRLISTIHIPHGSTHISQLWDEVRESWNLEFHK